VFVRTVAAIVTTSRTAVGAAVAALGIASLAILSVQPTLEVRISEYMSVYTKYEWVLAVILVVAGATIAVGSGTLGTLGAACGAIAAGQLGSSGATAFKQWYSFFGPTGFDSTHHEVLERLALVMAGLCLFAAVACVGYLAQRHAFRDDATSGPVRAGVVVTGVAVMIGLPIVLSIGDNSTELGTFAAFALLYSLPWGIAIVVSGWLIRSTAMGVYATVLVSAVLAGSSEHFISMGSQALGFGSAAALATLAGAMRYYSADQAGSVSSSADTRTAFTVDG
jgi:hypothetical protein